MRIEEHRQGNVPDWGIPLMELMQLPELTGTRVVAGHSNLQREVRGINVMEIPGALDWVRPNDFICTTAYAFREDLESHAKLIPALASRGVVALGVNTLYIQHIPETMVEHAKEIDFPLFEFPRDISFSGLIRSVTAAILNRQYTFLSQSEAIHQHLMDVALSDAGLSNLLQGLTHTLGNPTCLTNRTNTVLATTGEPLELFHRLLQCATVQGMLDTNSTTETFHFAERSLVDLAGKQVCRVNVEVRASGRSLGQIITWELNTHLTRLGYIVLEQAAAVAALLLLQKDAELQVERRYKNLLLDQLLTGQISSIEDAANYAEILKWNLTKPFMVLLVRFQTGRPVEKARALSESLASPSRPELVLAGERGGNLVYFYSPVDGDMKETRRQAKELGTNLSKDLQRLSPGVEIRVGISRICRNFLEASRGYFEANQATQAGNSEVQFFDDLGALRLVHSVKDREELKRFYQDTVEALVTYDQEHGTSFIETLRVFVQANGNVRQTAQSLYVHYNTVLYRIERIKEITGLDPQNPDERMNLQLGLVILDKARFDGGMGG